MATINQNKRRTWVAKRSEKGRAPAQAGENSGEKPGAGKEVVETKGRWIRSRRGWVAVVVEDKVERTKVDMACGPSVETRDIGVGSHEGPDGIGLLQDGVAEVACGPDGPPEPIDAGCQAGDVEAVACSTDSGVDAATQAGALVAVGCDTEVDGLMVSCGTEPMTLQVSTGTADDEASCLPGGYSVVVTRQYVPPLGVKRAYTTGAEVRGGECAVYWYANCRPAYKSLLWDVGMLSDALLLPDDAIFERIGAGEDAPCDLLDWAAVVVHVQGVGHVSYPLYPPVYVRDDYGGVFVIRRLKMRLDPWDGGISETVRGFYEGVVTFASFYLNRGSQFVGPVRRALPNVDKDLRAIGRDEAGVRAKFALVQAKCSNEAYGAYTNIMNAALANPEKAPNPMEVRHRVEQAVKSLDLVCAKPP